MNTPELSKQNNRQHTYDCLFETAVCYLNANKHRR